MKKYQEDMKDKIPRQNMKDSPIGYWYEVLYKMMKLTKKTFG